MLITPARQSLAFGIIVAAVLLLAWFIYQPATGGVFLLDDRPNLGALTSVTDTETAMQFVFSGNAGPVGRPLALATFLPQASAWDEAAAPFISVNILIHMLNGLLACLFFLQLSRARGVERPNDQLTAVAAMALWLFMPILASATLMVVQRMATLAAMFMLLGLNGYLYARSRIDAEPNRALVGMSASLVMATLLALLCKENGTLLPTLVLVLEATLLSRPRSLAPANWRAWGAIFLALPTVLIIGFLISRVPYSELAILKKDLTAWERLLTEARVLWEYLLNAFVARPAQYGPFRDGYPLAKTILDPVTLIAVLAWLASISAAFVWRRKYPLAAFAVLWFVAGHLLESTTVNLELYFEHRNYVPLIGPAYALCALALSVTGQYRALVRAALSLYILLNAAVLWSVTSLWGNPLGAASYWYVSSPDSARAAAHLAARQMTEMTAPTGIITLQEFVSQHPEHAYLRLHELTTSCRVSGERDHAALVRHLEGVLPDVSFTYSLGTLLDDLLSAISENECNGVDLRDSRNLAIAVHGNPRFAGDSKYNSFHHRLLARIAWDLGEREETMRHLELAHSLMPSDRLNALYVSVLLADRRFDEARQYIEELSTTLPMHPIRRVAAEIHLEQLRRDVQERELRAQNGSVSMNGESGVD